MMCEHGKSEFCIACEGKESRLEKELVRQRFVKAAMDEQLTAKIAAKRSAVECGECEAGMAAMDAAQCSRCGTMGHDAKHCVLFDKASDLPTWLKEKRAEAAAAGMAPDAPCDKCGWPPPPLLPAVEPAPTHCSRCADYQGELVDRIHSLDEAISTMNTLRIRLERAEAELRMRRLP